MTESYKNILEMIRINEAIKFDCKESLARIEYFFLKKGPKGYGKSTSYMDADLVHGDKVEIGFKELQMIAEGAEKLKSMLAMVEKNLIELYATKKKIQDTLSNLTGIEYDVARLKLVEGLKLKEIADKLHISEAYVKKISAKI